MSLIGKVVNNSLDKGVQKNERVAKLMSYAYAHGQEILAECKRLDSFTITTDDLFGEDISEKELSRIISSFDRDEKGAYIDTNYGRFTLKTWYPTIYFEYYGDNNQSTISESDRSESSFESTTESIQEQRAREELEAKEIEAERDRCAQDIANIFSRPISTVNEVISELQICKAKIAESTHYSKVAECNQTMKEMWQSREQQVREVAAIYANDPVFIAYLASEEQKNKQKEEEATAKAEAKKEKAAAKKKIEKAKQIIKASKKEERDLIDKQVSKVKLFVWLGWLGLNVFLFVIAEEWYHYVFIVLAIIISALIMILKLGDWLETPIKSKLIKEGKVKTEKQWIEEEQQVEAQIMNEK